MNARSIARVLGSPFDAPATAARELPPTEVDAVRQWFRFAHKNRVGLLFLETLDNLGLLHDAYLKDELAALNRRRHATHEVIVRLSKTLDQLAKGRYVIFKSLKPFHATPNDTDWFPLGDRRLHSELVQHLLQNGYQFLEQAPLQITLTDERGAGLVHTDKRGGIWYIDCYVVPGADYFVYLDPARLIRHCTTVQLLDHTIPVLRAEAELGSILFHSVFPEKTYHLEMFFLVLYYLSRPDFSLAAFESFVRENHIVRPVRAALSITENLHDRFFGFTPPKLKDFVDVFGRDRVEAASLARAGANLPYNYSFSRFVWAVLGKLPEARARRSLAVQAFHMLDPRFAMEVIRITWKRSTGGGVYEQQ